MSKTLESGEVIMAESVLELSEADFDNTVNEAGVPVLVDFGPRVVDLVKC